MRGHSLLPILLTVALVAAIPFVIADVGLFVIPWRCGQYIGFPAGEAMVGGVRLRGGTIFMRTMMNRGPGSVHVFLQTMDNESSQMGDGNFQSTEDERNVQTAGMMNNRPPLLILPERQQNMRSMEETGAATADDGARGFVKVDSVNPTSQEDGRQTFLSDVLSPFGLHGLGPFLANPDMLAHARMRAIQKLEGLMSDGVAALANGVQTDTDDELLLDEEDASFPLNGGMITLGAEEPQFAYTQQAGRGGFGGEEEQQRFSMPEGVGFAGNEGSRLLSPVRRSIDREENEDDDGYGDDRDDVSLLGRVNSFFKDSFTFLFNNDLFKDDLLKADRVAGCALLALGAALILALGWSVVVSLIRCTDEELSPTMVVVSAPEDVRTPLLNYNRAEGEAADRGDEMHNLEATVVDYTPPTTAVVIRGA